MTMPTLGYNGMETTDPNAICAAFLEPESRNSRDLMDCEVVRVLDTSYTREEGKVAERALLIMKKDGVAVYC